jgi:transposase-like protein
MARPVLNARHFQDESAGFSFVEAALWPNGPFCPHCGEAENVTRLQGKATRPGLFKCNSKGCRKQFTVRVGTIFESSHLPLHLWLQVIHLMSASKKGISTRQIQRMLNCSMKTAWHLTHRIREIMQPAPDAGPLGGYGETLEADVTYVGRKPGRKLRPGPGHMNPVFALVQRGDAARAVHMPNVRGENIHEMLAKNASTASHFRTDEAAVFTQVGWNFASHETVTHSEKQYVKRSSWIVDGKPLPKVHSNTVEGFFSILKRGVYGVYQHVSEHHLDRYLHEFSFRYSHREGTGFDDAQRASVALSGARGRRLTYQTTREPKRVSQGAR